MQHAPQTTPRLLIALALALAIAGCAGGRKAYPDPAPGWHSPSYNVLFGRLVKGNIPGGPRWVIRYDFANSTDPYAGRLALAPPQKLVGYAGGELVEVRGNLTPNNPQSPPGYTLYNIQAIRIWNGEYQH